MDTGETERFQCFICLDLIYKPVVLECGHVSCFWCVHKAMNAFQGSRCAICRHSFNFFPGICRVLHNLLLKIEPEAYKQREAEILEEEKRADCFSSQFIENSVDDGKPEISSNLIQTDALRENGVSISDVLCSGCRDLLFRPAVLNCGDVFCENCLGRLAGDKIKCPTCGDMQPGGLPNVCFDLDHFLEKEFPLEYARRRDSFKLEQSNTQTGGSSSSAFQTDTWHKQTMIQKEIVQIANDAFPEDEECLNVHVGVGCDACGVVEKKLGLPYEVPLARERGLSIGYRMEEQQQVKSNHTEELMLGYRGSKGFRHQRAIEKGWPWRRLHPLVGGRDNLQSNVGMMVHCWRNKGIKGGKAGPGSKSLPLMQLG